MKNLLQAGVSHVFVIMLAIPSIACYSVALEMETEDMPSLTVAAMTIAVMASTFYSVGSWASAQQKPSLAASQETKGSCSPAVMDVKGSVTITCYGGDSEQLKKLEHVPALLEALLKKTQNQAQIKAEMDLILDSVGPAPTDWFSIYIISEPLQGSSLQLSRFRFTYAEIQSNASYIAFRKIISQVPSGIPQDLPATIFRMRDERVLSSDNSIQVTTGGNLGVIVVPDSILKQYPDPHLAFVYLKSRIDQPGTSNP